jgi:hypothetical protein
MDRDSITRTGARAPRVERETACTEVAHKHIVPDTEQGTPMNAESTKDEGKPVHWEVLVGLADISIATQGTTGRGITRAELISEL